MPTCGKRQSSSSPGEQAGAAAEWDPTWTPCLTGSHSSRNHRVPDAAHRGLTPGRGSSTPAGAQPKLK